MQGPTIPSEPDCALFRQAPLQRANRPVLSIDRQTVEAIHDRLRFPGRSVRRLFLSTRGAPRMLVAFMKATGGINACASRYTKVLGKGGKSSR